VSTGVGRSVRGRGWRCGQGAGPLGRDAHPDIPPAASVVPRPASPEWHDSAPNPELVVEFTAYTDAKSSRALRDSIRPRTGGSGSLYPHIVGIERPGTLPPQIKRHPEGPEDPELPFTCVRHRPTARSCSHTPHKTPSVRAPATNGALVFPYTPQDAVSPCAGDQRRARVPIHPARRRWSRPEAPNSPTFERPRRPRVCLDDRSTRTKGLRHHRRPRRSHQTPTDNTRQRRRLKRSPPRRPPNYAPHHHQRPALNATNAPPPAAPPPPRKACAPPNAQRPTAKSSTNAGHSPSSAATGSPTTLR
jgi:hypothetical protein